MFDRAEQVSFPPHNNLEKQIQNYKHLKEISVEYFNDRRQWIKFFGSYQPFTYVKAPQVVEQ